MNKKIMDLVREKMVIYGTYLIEDRALLDIRDGLKPVQRRVLYNMFSKGYTPDKPHKKSASITGGTIADFHPHSQTSVYDTLTRLSQPFKNQIVFTDPQGNWGHFDGSGAAAERYTENRLSKIAIDLLFDDIKNNAVEMVNNFSGELKEPKVLPAKVPFALFNPQSGIAYGFTSSTISYNFNEVLDVIIGLLDETKTEEDVYNLVPDFPTGGRIQMPLKNIYNINKTADGFIPVKCKLVKDKADRTITITELPYDVTTSKIIAELIEKIKESKEPKFSGISDINDLSNVTNPAITIYLNHTADMDEIEKLLFKHINSMEKKQYIKFMGLTEENHAKKLGEYNLYSMIISWLEFRYNCKKRVLINELTTVSTRINLLKGVLIALANLDQVIKIVRNTDSLADTVRELGVQLNMPPVQATYVAELKLYRLNKMSVKSTEDEIASLEERKKEILTILNEDLITNLIYDELKTINQKYKFPRKTEYLDMVDATSKDFSIAIDEEAEYHIGLNHKLHILKSNKPFNVNTKLSKIGKAKNKDSIIFLTKNGNLRKVKVSNLTADTPLSNYCANEEIVEMLFASDIDNMDELIVLTKETSRVKKITKETFLEIENGLLSKEKNATFEYILLNHNNKNDVLFSTASGNLIRIKVEDIPSLSRSALGVLLGKEKIESCFQMNTGILLVVTEYGRIKFTDLEDPANEFLSQNRTATARGKMIVNLDVGDTVALVSEIPESFKKLIIKNDKEEVAYTEDTIKFTNRSSKGDKKFNHVMNTKNISVNILL